MDDRRFTFFESYFEAAQMMPDEDRLSFYEAVITYGITGEVPPMSAMASVAFTVAKKSIEKSAKLSRTNSKNAKRSRKSEQPESLEQPYEDAKANDESRYSENERTLEQTEQIAFPDIDIDKDVDSDEDIDSDEDKDGDTGGASATQPPRPPRPHRPSQDEWWEQWQVVASRYGVSANRYEADKAFFYYDSNGWLQANGNSVKRWKGTVATCFLKAHPELKGNQQGAKNDDVFSGYSQAAAR